MNVMGFLPFVLIVLIGVLAIVGGIVHEIRERHAVGKTRGAP